MDIRQLKYFVTIAEEGKITTAAKKLNIAQPPLSRQLKQMEEELGVILFDRDNKSLNLTLEGERLLLRAKELLNKLDETMAEVQELRKDASGILSVGSNLYCASLILSKVVDIREKNPGLTFKVWEGETIHLIKMLSKRQIEIAITNSPITEKSISQMTLESDPYVLVLPEKWTWNGSEQCRLEEIIDLPLILLRPNYGLGAYGQIVNEFQRLDLEPNILCECQDLIMLLGLVSSGFGATILPLSLLSLHSLGGLRVIQLKHQTLISEPKVIWRKNSYLSKAAKEFLKLF
ncbi:LysR family transcriptional regulator [Bacillus ginsengihumi]|uniref:LysR family transcriptional regulator n=1 Tax=Heyndrickxia ginsengihumi TaxID=363870 RepID=A0A0A6VB61_9BACI|nr:LysR family transcriptional regulator [Heyndrickxia ginsengihumi]KHD84791.1 LysR family transcriptional regulator [Heyndrickxia ginsengihumi]NEY18561.1 LysR family transcriptional regulator [Heyndrickxia ginsengihumi]